MRYALLAGCALIIGLVAGPVAFKAAGHESAGVPWYRASNASSGQAPFPAEESRAVIQVYAAPTYGWRGIFAVHTWIIVKPTGADAYRRYDVVALGPRRGRKQGPGSITRRPTAFGTGRAPIFCWTGAAKASTP